METPIIDTGTGEGKHVGNNDQNDMPEREGGTLQYENRLVSIVYLLPSARGMELRDCEVNQIGVSTTTPLSTTPEIKTNLSGPAPS